MRRRDFITLLGGRGGLAARGARAAASDARGGGMNLALAAKMSELFWSLDKPSLAALPFFVGC